MDEVSRETRCGKQTWTEVRAISGAIGPYVSLEKFLLLLFIRALVIVLGLSNI